MFDILIEDEAFTTVRMFGMYEPDVALALQQPWVSICNDSQGTAPDGVLGKEHPHPRAYGTFPRILRKYVREEHKLTLEDAIRKFTCAAGAAHAPRRPRRAEAGDVGRRGGVRSGDDARPRDVRRPNQLSDGMHYVLVNGVPVIEEGKMTNALPGTVVRGAGYRSATPSHRPVAEPGR